METGRSSDGKFSHPFGREEEVAVSQLFVCFCNNVSLGQWELARACVDQLHTHREKTPCNIQHILKAIADHPYDLRCGGMSVPTPHHLSWMCITEFEGLQTQEQLPTDIYQDTEFRLLIFEAGKGASDNILQEIYRFHCCAITKRDSSREHQLATLTGLSTEALSFLKGVLQQKPALGHAILAHLTVAEDREMYLQHNQALQKLYIDCIFEDLETLKNMKEDEDHIERSRDICRHLYDILALMNPSRDMVDLKLQDLFTELLSSVSRDQLCLKLSAINSCLLGRQDSFLLEELAAVENEMRLRTSRQRYVERVSVSGESAKDETDDQAVTMAMMMGDDRRAVWQNLFFRCLQGQRHILEDVVDTAVNLAKAGQFDELATLLAPAEFHPLCPLVLLLGLNHCYGCNNISRLMDGLWNSQDLSEQSEMMKSQPVLSQACRNLAYQVQLVQWCLDKTRPLVIESGAPITHHDRASQLFQGLESHSVLFMLHQATSLASLNQQEVLDLLHKQPSLPTGENSSKKIVRFAPVDDDSAEDISLSEGPQSLQQQRDISIYRGYCAIRCFMDAILHGQDLGMKARASSSVSAGSHNSNTQPAAQMEEMYAKHVTKNLEVGKDHLSQIQPLTFRAEVLENIFSLLFVTHDDLLDDRSVLSDSGGEEGQYELDRTNRGSRRESLLSCPPSLDSSMEMVSSTEVYRVLTETNTTWKPNVQGTVLDAILPASEGIAIGKEATVPGSKEEATGKEEPTTKTKRKKVNNKDHHPSLSDIAEPASEDKNGLSGHSSGRSGDGWTREVPRLGFLMDECLVRDVLAVLKECFLNLKSAKFAKLGQGQNIEDEDLLKCVSSSITESSLQQRISRLDQCINEAQWRFQLVVPEYVPKQPGLIAVGTRDTADTSSGDEMGSYYSKWEQDKRGRRQRKKQGSSTSRSRSETATSQGTGAESERSLPGSEQVTGTQTGTATDDSDKGRRRRRRNHSARCSSATSSIVLKRKTGIIPRMLATKDTLLNMCLQRGNYTQAHQVIKMFQFKNEANVAEVKFSENYESAIKQLQSVEMKSKGGNTSGKPEKPAVSKSPLGAIASAAAAGMASMSLNNIVDQLLKTEKLPTVVWADEEEMATKPHICSLIRNENVPAMIIFDLACTATNSWEVSRSLLEMADKKVMPAVKTQELQTYKLGKEDQHRISKAEESIAGFESVFRQIVGIVGKDSGESSSLVRPEVKAKFFQHSARDILGRGSQSLDGEEVRNQVSSLLEKEKAVERLVKALSEDGDIQTGEGKTGKTKRSAVQQAIQHLIKVFDGYPVLCSSLWHLEHLEGRGDEDVQWADFLRSLYTHVSTMTALLNEHQDLAKQGGVSQIRPANPFLVLSEGPTFTLGKLMFDKGVPPDQLQTVAEQLRMDLVHVIVQSCCPRVPLTTQQPQTSGDMWVLNAADLTEVDEMDQSSTSPLLLAEDLLIQMVNLLKAHAQDGVFDQRGGTQVCQSSDYQDLAAATQQLEAVDLTLLSTDAEKLCFFTNIFNLMLAHAALAQLTARLRSGSKDASFSLFYCSNPLDSVIWLSSIAYNIGQMGTVSALDLRFLVLHHGLPLPSHYSLLKDRLHGLSPNDPWHEFLPPADPRVLFVLTEGAASSPPLQVLKPDDVELQLETAVRLYLETQLVVDEAILHVKIPELLNWYKGDFLGVDPTPDDPLLALMSVLADHCPPHLADVLWKLEAQQEQSGQSQPRTTYSLVPFEATFQYVFMFERSTGSRQAKVEDSQLLSAQDSVSRTDEQSSMFRISSTTQQYLRNKSHLVATLAQLICRQSEASSQGENTEQPEEHQAEAEDHEESANDINQTVQSTTLHIEDEFPVLNNFIHAMVLPLSNQLTDIFEERTPGSAAIIPSLLSSHTDKKLAGNVKTLLLQLLQQGRMQEAVDIVENQSSVLDVEKTALLCDFVLCCAGTQADMEQSESWRYLLRVKDPDVSAHVVLACLGQWPVDVCVELLEMCAGSSPRSPALEKAVEKALQEMRVYQRIVNCALEAAPAVYLEEETGSSSLDADVSAFTRWQAVAEESVASPNKILGILLRAKDFTTTREWAELHNVPQRLKQMVEEQYVISLLEYGKHKADTTKAYQVLQNIGSESTCLSVCENILPKLQLVESQLFLLQYLLDHLQNELQLDKLQQFCLRKMGAKALLCLPSGARGEYDHLVTQPDLILEQLLMNMRVAWASQVVQVLHEELRRSKDIADLRCDQLDVILAKYAAKALDFPVVQYRNSSDSRSETPATLSPTPTPMEKTVTPSVTPSASPSLVRKHAGSPGKGDSSSLYSTSASGRSSASLLSSSVGQRSPVPSRKVKSNVGVMAASGYILPEVPPSRAQWVPDEDVTHCMVCKFEQFGMFNRRHHCRRCGRVVCYSCSSHKVLVAGYGDIPVRICAECHEQFYRGRSRPSSPQLEDRLKARLAGISTSPVASGASSATSEALEPDFHQEQLEQQWSWRLELEEDRNTAVREEFYYEQAPNTSLCVSLLNLHSDDQAAGQHMVQLSHSLSLNLNYPDVDSSLIISMLRYLLFNAKMKFMKAGESSGIEMCDTYLSHVDVLKMLAQAHFQGLPSIQELQSKDKARRLRDRLIEDERLDLAMDFSTKCGLDSAGVWAAWGMAYLRTGNFQAAREKFSRCLKPPSDVNMISYSSKMLTGILQCLESTSTATLAPGRDLVKNPYLGLSGSNRASQLSDQVFQECLYYLQMYGTHLDLINFYYSHNKLPKAVKYTLDKHCSPEVFIEGLLVPCLGRAQLPKLQDQMVMFDPTLVRWATYLTAACRYLNKNNRNYSLYQFQIFMKDYVRAAMTCIRFFSARASTYTELFDRLHHLASAKQHLTTVLEEQHSDSMGSKTAGGHSPVLTGRSAGWGEDTGSKEPSIKMTMSRPELNRHINTITLQTDVTKFLHRCMTLAQKGASSVGGETASPGNLPSLFGNNKVKSEVACMVLLAGTHIQDGFGLAFRIIQDFHLNATLVYIQAGRTLAKQKQYKEISQLLQCVEESGLSDEQSWDEIIGACLLVVADDPGQSKEAESLIKRIRSDANKINAYILCGKLKSAYLIAVRGERVDDIRRIAGTAERHGQSAVKSICDKWLLGWEEKRQKERQQQELLRNVRRK
ncbi:PREDICTED: zinc finger FYVE domain-containing protein 26-like [Branchiostoma belcheri]|uniref:Zinc finger FYVE domain-containing protein 26 n=1 Tax=Branchiostoma belcheri TaxID=7741 RepID=A0A6P4YW08_BRABE|nr:PREDICTED: zinc finger FYVE domain-containing protein 26-like [Branchiostoma belcheri]